MDTTFDLAQRQMAAARTALILDEPFFGVLALRLRLRPDPTAPTAWVDGVTLGYNPSWIASLSSPQRTALIAHEVMHCTNGHPWRRDCRDPERWNEACDRAINPVLRDAGFTLPADGLLELDTSHTGKSAEWIYARLLQPEAQQNGSGGKGEPQSGAKQQSDGTPQPGQQPGEGEDSGEAEAAPNPLGEVRDAPTGAADEGEGDTPTEADWQMAVQQAARAAQAQGKLPGGLERLVKELAQGRTDWKSVLHRFMQEAAKADYSWMRPNTRYIASNLFLPHLHSTEMGEVVVAIDTSGSVDTALLSQFAGELQTVMDDVHPSRIRVLYCDARIQSEETFERDDVIALHPRGGGGTDFRPVFKLVEEMDEPPVCVVYLTDLMGTFPAEPPTVPTLWLAPQNSTRVAPFGEMVVANT